MLYYSKTCERSMSCINAPVAQLDRVTDSDSVGHWFESSRAYQKSTGNFMFPVDFLFSKSEYALSGHFSMTIVCGEKLFI